MNDAVIVRCRQRLSELEPNPHGLIRHQAASPQPVGQRFSLDVLEHDGHLSIDFEDVVHGRDVRVIDRGGRAGLGHHLFARDRARRFGPGKQLERNFTIEPRVVGEVDRAHAASPKRARHAIGTDLGHFRQHWAG
jgi:hypothetical protein